MRFIMKEVVVYDVIDTEHPEDNGGFMSRQATQELADASAQMYEEAANAAQSGDE